MLEAVMPNKINIPPDKQAGMIYALLIVSVLAVFSQLIRYGFVIIDDPVYVIFNRHITSGITLDSFIWAVSTKYADLWHPLVWFSFMLDYRVFGLNAGGYHLTNLLLHMMSSLMLFWLFHRMTRALWKSAFIAAFFALHPLHVESVAWISERKDVLSAFFWMLTLCLYVVYTEKPATRRYGPVVLSFVCALMSKPMVVTLPVVMLLLDYWPLGRFAPARKNLMWQFKEKFPFFLLSLFVVIVTLYDWKVTDIRQYPLDLRLANACISFAAYLIKTFWPVMLSIFYPFPDSIPVLQLIGSAIVIAVVSVAVVRMRKRLPCLFTGWLWYAVTILPVIKIVQISSDAMADRYHYLPSIGIAVMIAWGVPLFFKEESYRKRMMFPAAVLFLLMLAFISWRQCGFWQNSVTLLDHAAKGQNNVYVLHEYLGHALYLEGRSREAIVQFNKAILLNPAYAGAYVNRGNVYAATRNYDEALKDYQTAVRLRPDEVDAHYMKGMVHSKTGRYQQAIDDFNRTIALDQNHARAFHDRGIAYFHLGRYEQAISDYDEAIRRNPDFTLAYHNRAYCYFMQRNDEQGCSDARKACARGDCDLLSAVQLEGRCR